MHIVSHTHKQRVNKCTCWMYCICSWWENILPPSLFLQYQHFEDKMWSCRLPYVHAVYERHSRFLLDKWWISPLEPPLGSYWLSLQLPIYKQPITHSSREVLATAGEVLIENNLEADGWIAPQEHPYTPLMNTSLRGTHTSEMLKVVLKHEFACHLSSVLSPGLLGVRRNLRTWRAASWVKDSFR